MLVHKSVKIASQFWKKLRADALTADASLRDYLAFLIDRSSPIDLDISARQRLQQIVELQRDGEGAPIQSPPLREDEGSVCHSERTGIDDAST
jgi:hypothetical protein